jgi:hypothetical protein
MLQPGGSCEGEAAAAAAACAAAVATPTAAVQRQARSAPNSPDGHRALNRSASAHVRASVACDSTRSPVLQVRLGCGQCVCQRPRDVYVADVRVGFCDAARVASNCHCSKPSVFDRLLSASEAEHLGAVIQTGVQASYVIYVTHTLINGPH